MTEYDRLIQKSPQDCQEIMIKLNNHILIDHNIKTLEDLQKWILSHLPKESLNSSNRILLIFSLTGPRDCLFQFIHDRIPAMSVDFRQMYFNARQEAPWESTFGEAPIKILIHIRQGDTASILTPWDTYLCLWPSENAHKEFKRFEDIPNNETSY